MQVSWKVVLTGFAICCLVNSEILTGLFLCYLMVNAVKWILVEAAKRQ